MRGDSFVGALTGSRVALACSRMDRALASENPGPERDVVPRRHRIATILLATDDDVITRTIGGWLTKCGKAWVAGESLAQAADEIARGVERVIIDWRWRHEGAPLTLIEMCRARGIPVVILATDPDAPDLPQDVQVLGKDDEARLALASWLCQEV